MFLVIFTYCLIAEGGDDFFWNDYEDYDYENYVEISKDDPKYYKPEPRINYELFGFDTEDEDSDDRNGTLCCLSTYFYLDVLDIKIHSHKNVSNKLN